MTWPVRAWRRAFRDDVCLPASVLGPVDLAAFSRLVWARDFFMAKKYQAGAGNVLTDFGKWLRAWQIEARGGCDWGSISGDVG